MNKTGKKSEPRISLRYKIMLYVVLLLVITIGITTYIAVKVETQFVRNSLVQKAQLLAKNIAFGAENAFWSLNWSYVEKMLSDTTADESQNVIHSLIVKSDGEIYMADDRELYGRSVSDYLLVSNDKVFEQSLFGDSQDESLSVIHPLQIGSEQWYVMMEVSTAPIKNTANTLIFQNLLLCLVIVLFGIFASFFLARSICNPISKLTKAARKISAGNLSYKVDTNSNDEVGTLATAFNSMAEDLNRTTTSIDKLNKEIEKRRKAENTLSKERKQFISMLSGMSEPVYVCDKYTYELLYLNDAAKQVWGDKVGEKCYKAIQGRNARCRFCTNEKIFGENSGKTYTWEVKNGINKRYYRCTDRAIQWPGRGLVRFEMAVDIHDRKKAEKKYRTLFDSSRDAIMMLNPESGLFTTVNPATLTIFGAKNDREITSVTPSILSPQYQPDGQLSSVKAAEMINTAIKNGSHFFEWTHQKINGDKFPANVRLVKIELEGKLYLQATVRDITAQKKAEEKINQEKDRAEQLNDELLKATTKSREMAALAEKANNSKSEFLANMSHEIRTPMNAIIGFSDILAEENLSSNQLENVNIIKDSANNLLRIINDILDFSKIEAGRLDVESVDCSLGRLLNSVYSMMKNKADKKGLEFEVVVDDDVPETVKTDPARLQQCLVNLINNAVKFTEKGHIIVKVSKNSIDGKCFISFAVEDTGIGIAEEKQDIIFESFTQEDGTISRKFGGTGLGLAITKRLANLLGGNLELESEQGKGSVFTLTAAADEIAGNLKSVGSESVIESSSNKEHQNSEDDKLRDNFDGRILVAEDVKTNQVLIKSLLKRLGLECVIAEDGKEAVEKAQSESFDLILMDIHMPNMDGYDATQALREKGNKTAIIALTAKAMKDDRQKCIDAGCNDYMTKPIKRQELIKILNQYIPRLSREKPIQV